MSKYGIRSQLGQSPTAGLYAVSHFHKIPKMRQKQESLDRYLVKVAKEGNSLEPIDSSDVVSDSESHPTQ